MRLFGSDRMGKIMERLGLEEGQVLEHPWLNKSVEKAQRRVEERLAIYLLSRAGQRDLAPGDKIKLAEPRNLIAAQCGTAPEVLSRTFRRLEDDGVLEAAPRHVTIKDPQKLSALAELIE